MVTVKDILDKDISKKDLNLFEWPSKKDLVKTKTTRLHLADFIFWDAERQSEFVRDYLGWEEDHVEGTYKKYKSVECIMPGVHDYSKYLKEVLAEVRISAQWMPGQGLLQLWRQKN